MSSEILREHVEQQRLVDSHEHLRSELDWTTQHPDVIECLFPSFYAGADLRVAGAGEDVIAKLFDPHAGAVSARFATVADAWSAMSTTGYGEGARLAANRCLQLEEIASATLVQGQARVAALQQPRERLHLLRDVALLDHVQIDAFDWVIEVDPTAPEFFLYDISWADFACGRIERELILERTGIEVRDLESLSVAFETIFERYGPVAIAVKSQHAYDRTLCWTERSDSDALRALHAILGDEEPTEADRLCLGDWCLARGVEMATTWNLPIKLHTGYYAGIGDLPVERIAAGHLWRLFSRYPDARFVVMHTAYPYDREMIALAKKYPNVWVDLCWAWAVDPFSTLDFVRRFLHAVPTNKLFAFGGDTDWPIASVGYASQARTWLARALQAEVDDGYLSEPESIRIATRIMRSNQYECFDVRGRQREARRRANLAIDEKQVGTAGREVASAAGLGDSRS
jgi:predicted TIM-barrel fold metal-dependent hydrolase